MKLVDRPSPNRDSRGGAPVDILVLHYTGMPSGDAALARLCDPAAKVSAHYLIDEDGTVYALVPEEARAWHAGVSYWAGARDINARSIGIELVNPGHEFGYRAFPKTQIAALIELANAILARHPIPAWRVLGHSDVAPRARTTPANCSPGKNYRRKGSGFGPAKALIPVRQRSPSFWRAMAMTRRRPWKKPSRLSSAISAPPAWTAWQIPKHVRCLPA